MTSLWWLLLGVAAGVAGMLPITWLLLRRGDRRAREAERRARDAERLAELGRMTGGLAHEIKNPLSTIGLNAELLAEAVGDADLPDDQRERLVRRLDALRRETERLSGILTDFLQFAGRIRIDPQPRDMVRIVEELSDFFHPQCAQQGILLRTDLPDHPLTVRVDETLLKQALLNLMINASQAMGENDDGAAAEGEPRTPRGELILRLEADDAELRFHVIDTGPGIDSSRREEIFHPYVSHKAGGTGLGLPTARRIIEEHGGRLDLQSEIGRGSDFIVHLPVAES
ncbi:MAG: sensor histidine kinase [Planctomycetota bacterium]|jgi:signal transduction histidine kinase